MWPFSKRCAYCREKTGEPIERRVKVPGYIGLHKRHFCSEEHLNAYEKEVAELGKKKGGCC